MARTWVRWMTGILFHAFREQKNTLSHLYQCILVWQISTDVFRVKSILTWCHQALIIVSKDNAPRVARYNKVESQDHDFSRRVFPSSQCSKRLAPSNKQLHICLPKNKNLPLQDRLPDVQSPIQISIKCAASRNFQTSA